MRLVRWNSAALLAAALALPTVASAQFELTIDAERLDGVGFTFEDNEQEGNNEVVVDADGATITARGEVQAVTEGTVVTITYELSFPDGMSASERSLSVAQDAQVLIGILVNFPAAEDYFGQAAPRNCKASVKISDRGGPPDSPDASQASLSCDLGPDFRELDDDDNPETVGAPGPAEVEAIVDAFSPRKDVKVDSDNGKLTIKHKGRSI